MIKQPSADDMVNLSPQEMTFVIEYSKDFSARRAAVAAGWSADSGYQVRDRQNVQTALNVILLKRLESSHIDADWVLMEAVDNHSLARQAGNIPASNTALNMIMRHTMVDAIASDKLNMNVHTDKDVLERLVRGRERLKERDGDTDEDDGEVSFI